MKIKAKDLELRNIVRSFDGGYSTATVIKKDKDGVFLFRPFVTTSDFECTAGVMPYIGIEEYFIGNNTEVELIYTK